MNTIGILRRCPLAIALLASQRSLPVFGSGLGSQGVEVQTIVATAADSYRVAVARRSGRERVCYCLLEAGSDRGTIEAGSVSFDPSGA